MTPSLTECQYTDVAKWRSLAAKDRVAVTDTKRTRWFLYRVDQTVYGFCGLLLMAGVARIKSVYIFKPYRGQGHGDRMTRLLIEAAAVMGYCSLDVLAWNPKWYIRMGWREIGRTRTGAVRLRGEI